MLVDAELESQICVWLEDKLGSFSRADPKLLQDFILELLRSDACTLEDQDVFLKQFQDGLEGIIDHLEAFGYLLFQFLDRQMFKQTSNQAEMRLIVPPDSRSNEFDTSTLSAVSLEKSDSELVVLSKQKLVENRSLFVPTNDFSIASMNSDVDGNQRDNMNGSDGYVSGAEDMQPAYKVEISYIPMGKYNKQDIFSEFKVFGPIQKVTLLEEGPNRSCVVSFGHESAVEKCLGSPVPFFYNRFVQASSFTDNDSRAGQVKDSSEPPMGEDNQVMNLNGRKRLEILEQGDDQETRAQSFSEPQSSDGSNLHLPLSSVEKKLTPIINTRNKGLLQNCISSNEVEPKATAVISKDTPETSVSATNILNLIETSQMEIPRLEETRIKESSLRDSPMEMPTTTESKMKDTMMRKPTIGDPEANEITTQESRINELMTNESTEIERLAKPEETSETTRRLRTVKFPKNAELSKMEGSSDSVQFKVEKTSPEGLVPSSEPPAISSEAPAIFPNAVTALPDTQTEVAVPMSQNNNLPTKSEVTSTVSKIETREQNTGQKLENKFTDDTKEEAERSFSIDHTREKLVIDTRRSNSRLSLEDKTFVLVLPKGPMTANNQSSELSDVLDTTADELHPLLTSKDLEKREVKINKISRELRAKARKIAEYRVLLNKLKLQIEKCINENVAANSPKIDHLNQVYFDLLNYLAVQQLSPFALRKSQAKLDTLVNTREYTLSSLNKKSKIRKR